MRIQTLFLAMGLTLGVACGESDKGDDDTASGECGDPDYNPYAGTCVESFMAACFDPSGECDGTYDLTGNTTLTWENGAQVVSEVGVSGTSAVVITTLYASSGTECAVGETTQGAGGCFSQTVYTRTSDGATQTWCTQEDGSVSVTCDDGSTVDVDASQSTAAEECQYGSDAGACEVTQAR